ncbi:transcription factor IIIB 90 kDa subunit [Nilaparvata lugens]|uniref:transcription factor IIIB 90 kDa subunit n=1 Tax=Nilaparvata lugens TaxID=108931 RepID=UPI00193DD916|nr:transcription factor IIIB 90 kDa subunit [Nilaparvata lugens]
MTGNKCKSCGSSELEVDPARGDTVCTNCGTVLEDSVIVSELQFEENAHGGSSALGQFVASDSKGGCRGFGSNFHTGMTKESREITLQNAKRGITNLCQQLRLNQHCTDTAYNFYKLALTRGLTRGRKNPLVLAACVYITCRIEGTPHLLIDFSEVLQICAYELGKTYLRLSQALCIKIPSMDPCLYVLRYANKLEFGDKTHEVAMTALRLVQRMKKDSLHSGRHPSGLCGAALLMAARLHDFNRNVNNIIRIVNVHETTLKKRLMEFGDTLTSKLTLEEFLSVDLEEEQDPPSYKAARLKDSERLNKLMEDEKSEQQLTDLQWQIEKQLNARQKNKRKRKNDCDESITSDIMSDSVASSEDAEEQDTNRFLLQSTMGVVQEYISNGEVPASEPLPTGLGPSIECMGLDRDDSAAAAKQATASLGDATAPDAAASDELDLEGIDDDEIDAYIMSEEDARNKHRLWLDTNAPYLKEQKEKEERLAKEREEGKPEKKKRKATSRKSKSIGPSSSAGEAIKKMLQEKKISTKINYDVLKTLNVPLDSEEKSSAAESVTPKQETFAIPSTPKIKSPKAKVNVARNVKKEMLQQQKIPDLIEVQEEMESKKAKEAEVRAEYIPADLEDYDEEEEEVEVETEGQMSLAQMLNQHRDDDEYYGYDDDDY